MQQAEIDRAVAAAARGNTGKMPELLQPSGNASVWSEFHVNVALFALSKPQKLGVRDATIKSDTD